MTSESASTVLPLAGHGAAGDTAAEQRARIAVLPFALVCLQLVLLLLLVRQFQIEGKAFVMLAALAFAGFLVHAWLPLRLRLPFFAALSIGSIFWLLGPANAAWIVAIGAALVGLCHLPVAPRWRVALLLAAAALLMAQRARLLPVPWSEAIWPILGSMFMFRLIVYFYDLTHDKARVTPVQSASYFAMLPNVCFPLFPVIDFKTYRRSHYARDAYPIYQKGIDWMARGVLHLILYRYIYLHLTLAPAEVDAPADLIQYLVTNFMLYLRVSGLFHLIVGMLHLFGFDLPETHHRYLLASSFTDYWRRINIYWKDFMQKIFYFPAVFALKRLGATWAVVLATVYVFALTWFLHSYQWFWLRGSWLLSAQDALFWALLGVLVVLNSLVEIHFGRKRKLGAPAWSLGSTLATIAKTYATFWFICILWSFWSAESVGAWLTMWSAGLAGSFSTAALLFPALALAIIVLGSIPQRRAELEKDRVLVQRLLRRDALATLALMLALLALSVESVHVRLGTGFANVMHTLRAPQLSRLDSAKMERGYYENLMDVGGFNSPLWELYAKKPSNWLAADFTGLKRFDDSFAQYQLITSSVSQSQYGPITMNRHGLRDQEYAAARPPGTLRVALVGASSLMGWGVGDDQTFEALLEQRLARQPLATGFDAVQLLNFGVPGYQPPQQLVNLERALALHPNALFYVATGREQTRSANYLAEVVRKGIAIPYPGLQAIVAQAGARAGMDETELLRRLEPLGERILQQVYLLLAERCRALGVAPVWVFLPQVRGGAWQQETPQAERLAREAGFRVVNLDGVFDGHQVEAVRLAEWDEHPSVLAHRLVAERLYDEMARLGPALFEGAAR